MLILNARVPIQCLILQVRSDNNDVNNSTSSSDTLISKTRDIKSAVSVIKTELMQKRKLFHVEFTTKSLLLREEIHLILFLTPSNKK